MTSVFFESVDFILKYSSMIECHAGGAVKQVWQVGILISCSFSRLSASFIIIGIRRAFEFFPDPLSHLSEEGKSKERGRASTLMAQPLLSSPHGSEFALREEDHHVDIARGGVTFRPKVDEQGDGDLIPEAVDPREAGENLLLHRHLVFLAF